MRCCCKESCWAAAPLLLDHPGKFHHLCHEQLPEQLRPDTVTSHLPVTLSLWPAMLVALGDELQPAWAFPPCHAPQASVLGEGLYSLKRWSWRQSLSQRQQPRRRRVVRLLWRLSTSLHCTQTPGQHSWGEAALAAAGQNRKPCVFSPSTHSTSIIHGHFGAKPNGVGFQNWITAGITWRWIH